MVLIDAFNWYWQQDLGRVFVEPVTLTFYVLFRLTKKNKCLQSFYARRYREVQRKGSERKGSDIRWRFVWLVLSADHPYKDIVLSKNKSYQDKILYQRKRTSKRYRFLCCKKKKLTLVYGRRRRKHCKTFVRQNICYTHMSNIKDGKALKTISKA